MEGLLIQGLRLKGVASDKLGFDGVADKFTDGLAAHLMVSDADAGNSNIGLDLHNGEADGLHLAGGVGKVALHTGIAQGDLNVSDLYVIHINMLLEYNLFILRDWG